MWVIMALHVVLEFVCLCYIFLFIITHIACPAINLHNVFRQITDFLSLFILHSIYLQACLLYFKSHSNFNNSYLFVSILLKVHLFHSLFMAFSLLFCRMAPLILSKISSSASLHQCLLSYTRNDTTSTGKNLQVNLIFMHNVERR